MAPGKQIISGWLSSRLCIKKDPDLPLGVINITFKLVTIVVDIFRRSYNKDFNKSMN